MEKFIIKIISFTMKIKILSLGKIYLNFLGLLKDAFCSYYYFAYNNKIVNYYKSKKKKNFFYLLF